MKYLYKIIINKSSFSIKISTYLVAAKDHIEARALLKEALKEEKYYLISCRKVDIAEYVIIKNSSTDYKTKVISIL